MKKVNLVDLVKAEMDRKWSLKKREKCKNGNKSKHSLNTLEQDLMKVNLEKW